MVEIHRMEIPGPGEIGDVNCYLLKGERNVLIDPGPGTPEASKTLGEELRELGLALEDIDIVLVTHPHSDHFGGVRELQEAGADCMVHEDAAGIVSDYRGHREELEDHFSDYFRRMGMPAEDAEKAVSDSLPGYTDVSFEPDDSFRDDDRVELGDAELECLHTPGHARGSTCFVLEEENVVFTGDTLLPDVTPNPMLELPVDDEGHHSLERYLESLRELRELGPMEALPGHGERIDSIENRADRVLEHHSERLEEVSELVEEPMTAFQVMEEMFPDIQEESYFFGMSEAVGHLEVLVERGKIRKEEDTPVKYLPEDDGT